LHRPPLSIQRTTSDGLHLGVYFGFTHNKEEYGCSTSGEYSRKRVLEWKLRMMDRLSSCKTKRNLTRSKNFRYSHTNLNCYQRTLKGLHKKWKGSGQHSGTKCRENNEIRQRALAGALWASQEPQVMPKQTNSCSSAWSCKTGKRIEVIIWIHGCIDSPYFDRPSSVMKTRVKREKSSMKH